MGFAENVRSELEFQDIHIKELADKTGISKNTLDKYLSGKKALPRIDNAVKIAEALGVSVEYLAVGRNTGCELQISNIPFEFRTIINQYRQLNAFNRKTIEDILESMVSRQ